MPEISRFYGISIYMYYFDHNPPHFHVVYNEYEAIYGLDLLNLIDGYVPKRVNALVKEWAKINYDELKNNWNRCRFGMKIIKIKPLV